MPKQHSEYYFTLRDSHAETMAINTWLLKRHFAQLIRGYFRGECPLPPEFIIEFEEPSIRVTAFKAAMDSMGIAVSWDDLPRLYETVNFDFKDDIIHTLRSKQIGRYQPKRFECDEFGRNVTKVKNPMTFRIMNHNGLDLSTPLPPMQHAKPLKPHDESPYAPNEEEMKRREARADKRKARKAARSGVKPGFVPAPAVTI